ncbi:MAG: hypothetical protein AAF304_00040 [Pseudomonadota bacterium]
MLFRIILLLIISATIQAHARPVSYPGGWTVSTFNDADRYSGFIHYSPTAFYSIGYHVEYWRDRDYQIHALHINNLIKRWNAEASQGNFYLMSGIGFAHSDEGDFDNRAELAAYGGIAADWETRKVFFSYANRYTDAGNIADSFRQKARFGFAPYVTEYGNWHTWLMMEVRHAPESKDQFVATPLVRLFKGADLFEAGVSDQGDVLFNFVHRF